jgi:lipopolysaccharide transport system permease protein
MPLSTCSGICKLLKKLVLFNSTVPRRLPGAFFLQNLVERRSLLFQLVRRDFDQRFVGSAMGWVWGLIHPLVLLISWMFVFQICMRVPPPPGVGNYPLFIFAGMLPWLLFSESVQRSASSLLDHSSLITKTVFPAEMIPVSVFLSTLLSHVLAVVLMVAATGVWINRISAFLFLLPLYFVVIGLFAIGLGWIVASLHVFLRDTAQLLSVVLVFWFWLTPIFITENQFPPWARFLLVANPLYYVVRAYRTLLLGSNLPDLGDFAISAVYGVALFVAGGFFFRYMKRGFADVL